MDLPTVAVTGVTGVLGRLVAERLAEAGIAQRLLARRPEKAPRLPGAIAQASSYGDGATAARALAGVRTLFMVSAAESAERLDEHRAFIDSAAAAGVEQIVYTSFFGASPAATFTLARDHDITEKYIVGKGLDHTFLRDNLYLDFLDALVGADGVIRGPAGEGRVSGVARADIARVAATILQDPRAHAGRTYDLTGREALSMAEVAAILSRRLDRRISFRDETVEEAYASRRGWDAPGWQLDAWVSTYTAIAAGEMARVSPDVERLTGRAPMTLDEFLAARGQG